MKKIFVCACIRYEKDTKKLSEKLEEVGFKVNYAAKDTPQNSDEEIYHHNLKLIKGSDLFVAYFVRDGHYGIDFAIEVGKASEMGKQVIGFIDLSSDKIPSFKDRLNNNVMFKHSFTRFVWSTFELVDYLKSH